MQGLCVADTFRLMIHCLYIFFEFLGTEATPLAMFRCLHLQVSYSPRISFHAQTSLSYLVVVIFYSDNSPDEPMLCNLL